MLNKTVLTKFFIQFYNIPVLPFKNCHLNKTYCHLKQTFKTSQNSLFSFTIHLFHLKNCHLNEIYCHLKQTSTEQNCIHKIIYSVSQHSCFTLKTAIFRCMHIKQAVLLGKKDSLFETYTFFFLHIHKGIPIFKIRQL